MRPRSGAPGRPMSPTKPCPGTCARVVHLHRRAGFAATWDELQRDLKDGPEASIDRLLEGKSRSCGIPADFAAFADRLADRALAAPDSSRLKAWWVYRMLFGPDPLTERLTLMWHDHFATSNVKVNNLALMRRQNETLRSLCRAPFGRLLHAMLRDPALLVWLDAPENPKGHPNENLARELMELFTLGIGHYSEDDVKQAARALTGWRLVGDEVRLIPVAARPGHEDHPRPHRPRSTPTGWRRCSWSIPPRPAGWPGGSATSSSARGRSTTAALDALAEGLRAHDLDIGWGVATVLRSRLFFDAANLGRRVASPIDYRRRCRAGPRDVRPGAEHAGAGRLVRAAGPGPVLSAQRRRLARRPSLDHDPLGDRPGQLRRGPGRRRVGRPGYVVRPDRAGRPPWPGAEPVVLRAIAARCRWPRGPARCAGAGPAGPRSTAGLARRAADLTPFPGGKTVITRRRFLARGLRDSTLIALAPTLPGFLARTAHAAGPEKDGRILVVVQLDGGNDGINTVVPFKDEGYAKYRKAHPPAREAADPGQRGGRPAPGDARRGEAAGIGPAGDRSGRGLSEPEPLALPQHGDLAIGPARRAGPHRAGLGRPRPRRGPADPRRRPGGAC